MQEQGTKRCSACAEHKPPQDFYRDTSKGDGLSSRCRDCTKAAVTKWARENPERRAGIARRWVDRNPIQHAYSNRKGFTDEDRAFIPVLLADPCAYCGGPADVIDHIDPRAERGWTNLTPACRSCNSSKEELPLLLWLAGSSRKLRRSTNAYPEEAAA